MHRFPVIDPVATGRNILNLRQERGLTVRDVQRWFNFEEPRCIYKWQSGQTLPSVDNLYALSILLGVSMDRIIVGTPDPTGSAAGNSLQQPPFWGVLSAVEKCFAVWYNRRITGKGCARPAAGHSRRWLRIVFPEP